MERQEVISALADGQLSGAEFARAVEQVSADADARRTWHTYHLIGEVLRSGTAPVGGAQPEAFLAGISARLARDDVFQPVALPPAREPHRRVEPAAAAANDANYRWKLAAGFASFVAVAAVGWSVLGAAGPSGSAVQPQLAAAPPAAPAPMVATSAGPGSVMIRDARLDEFLAAHRELGGASALQMPAGFLRNATFEGPSR